MEAPEAKVVSGVATKARELQNIAATITRRL
jgi:hypothetical protein